MQQQLNDSIKLIPQGTILKRICKINPKLVDNIKNDIEGFIEKYGNTYIARKESTRHKNSQKMTVSIYVIDNKTKKMSKISKIEIFCSWHII